jgi:hypothetical protein
VSTIAPILARQMSVTLITLDEGKQPDNLMPADIRDLLSAASTET